MTEHSKAGVRPDTLDSDYPNPLDERLDLKQLHELFRDLDDDERTALEMALILGISSERGAA